MGANRDVFQRIEKKYRLSSSQRAAVEAALMRSMAPDSYGRSTITSVYLDTPERALIDRSLERPLYKEKLRLRTYGKGAGQALLDACRTLGQGGEAASGSCSRHNPVVFVELKKKFKGVVYKRRIDLPLDGAIEFVRESCGPDGAVLRSKDPAHGPVAPQLATGADVPFAQLGPLGCIEAAFSNLDQAGKRRHLQIARELGVALRRYPNLAPAMAIRCERVAWAPVAADSEGLRITFDDQLCFLDLCDQDAQWQPIITSGESIMEVKCPGGLPLWLVDVLTEERVFPTSFSKYGTAHHIEKGLLDAAGALHWRPARTELTVPAVAAVAVAPAAFAAAKASPSTSAAAPSRRWTRFFKKGNPCLTTH